MGIEAQSRSRLRKTKIRQAVLTSIKAAGMVSTALLAPNVLMALGKLSNRSGLLSAQSSIERLRRAGMVETFSSHDGSTYVRLTKKGNLFLQREIGHIHVPLIWDGRWRVVIFDIPEQKRRARDALRSRLAEIGFKKLQESVWLYPYDCEDLLTLIKTDFRVGKDVLYIIADSIENDRNLRSHFGLPMARN